MQNYSRWHSKLYIYISFFYFSEKTRLDISSELLTFHMNCLLQILFGALKVNKQIHIVSVPLVFVNIIFRIHSLIGLNKRECQINILWVLINPCHAEYIKIPRQLLISSQSDYLIRVFVRNLHI